MIDIVTDLDPHFGFPYIFGSVVMSQDMGNFERGVGILKKGMQQNPEEWEYPFEIGFLYYMGARDSDRASRYFELASRLPGGGDTARRFAAFVHSKAGHEETSIRMWEEIARAFGSALHARTGQALHREAARGRSPARRAKADAAGRGPEKHTAMTSSDWIIVAAGGFGALFGSFLNVVIYRLPRGISVVGGRSQCPHCHETIRWFDNVPVLSWLLLARQVSWLPVEDSSAVSVG